MLRPGDEPIPGYRLESFLGRGQYGQVWRSTAPGGGSAALKFLDLGGKEGWKEFRGIQRVKEIRHAHLMPITAFWLLDEDGNILNEDEVRELSPSDNGLRDTVLPNEVVRPDRQARWLVIAQLLGEKTLADELRECKDRGERGIPIEDLLVYIEEAAKGIDYLNSERHDLGHGLFGVHAVQHCDIKPDNLLLLGDSVLVCDFGLAQILSPDTDARTTGIQGSPAYIAPECIERRPSATSDQYSLAVSYFELRTGELPLEDLTPLGALEAHRSGNLTLAELPEWEAAVIAKATAMAPDDRYPNCLAMVRALQQAAGVTGPATPEPSRWAFISKLAIPVALALVAVVAILLLTRPQGPGQVGVQIEVSPPDAKLTIDGEAQELADGRTDIERAADATLNLVASHGADYEVQSMQVDLAKFDNSGPVIIHLERSAVYLARSAEQQLANDQSDRAIGNYAKAIQKDARFGRFPVAIELPNDGSKNPSAEVRFMQLSRNGRWLVAADSDGTVRRWRVQGSELAEQRPVVLQRHSAAVNSLAVGNDWAVSSDQDGHVNAYTLDPPAAKVRSFTIETFADIKLEISRDDQYALTGSDGQLRRWELTSDDVANTEKMVGKHDDFIESITVTADDQYVITGSWDGSVKRWRLDGADDGTTIGRVSDDVYVVSISGDNIAFAGAETDGENHVFVTDSDGRRSQPLPGGHSAPIISLAFDKTGHWLAAGSEDDGQVSVWKRDRAAAQWQRLPLPNQHTDTVNSLAFHRTSPYLCSASNDGAITLWDLNANRRRAATIAQGHAPFVRIQLTHDGRWLLAACADGTIHAWDLRKCILIKEACDSIDRDALPPGVDEAGVEA